MKKISQLEKYGMSLINLCKLINDRQLTIITDKTYLSANDLIILKGFEWQLKLTNVLYESKRSTLLQMRENLEKT